VHKPPHETWKRVNQERLSKENRAFIPKGPMSDYELVLNRGMLFQSTSFWNLMDRDLQVISLTTPHRHCSDPELPELMRRLRVGSPSERKAATTTLNACCYRPPEIDDNEQVWLFPQNKLVDIKNKERLDALPYAPVTFSARDEQKPAESENQTQFEARRRLLADSSFFNESDSTGGVPKKLALKKNALVMLCANVDISRGLVNGAVGHVVQLSNSGPGYVLVDFVGIGRAFINPYTFQWKIPGVGTCVRKQIPLRLAWAISHHRSQGKTLTNVNVDPRAFAYGQAYVAVSRSRSMQNLTLLEPAKPSDFMVNPAVLHWMQYLKHPSDTAREKIGHWRDVSLPWLASKQQSAGSRATWPRRG